VATNNSATVSLVLLAGSPAALARPAPADDGDGGGSAAVLLVLLGIGVLLMSLRNLRTMRHKRLAHRRRRSDPDHGGPED
jgi:hypothetical protein